MTNTDIPVNTSQDTLFYDGQCPVCRKEINWLRQLQQGRLRFQDIHQLKNNEYIPNKNDMLRTLHLQRHDNTWALGLDATVLAWSHTSYGWLVKPLRWPIIKIVADKVYTKWASQRYQKRHRCDVCR